MSSQPTHEQQTIGADHVSSTSEYTHVRNTEWSEQSSTKVAASVGGPSVVTVEDVFAMGYDSYWGPEDREEGAMGYIPTYARNKDCPDAFDVEEAGHRKLQEELRDYEQLCETYYADFLNRNPQPDHPPESSDDTNRPPKFSSFEQRYLEIKHRVQVQTRILNSMLLEAGIMPQPSQEPEPSISPKIEPDHIFNLPLACLLLRNPTEKTQTGNVDEDIAMI